MEKNKPTVSIIVAIAANNAIGKNNDLVWSLPDDFKHFKASTFGHPIIMGRKTFESLGKPLPKRENIVISRSENFQAEGCHVVNTLAKALQLAAQLDNTGEIFIIGGATIYEQALAYTHRAYVTLVHAEPEADTFLPLSHFENWIEISRDVRKKDEKNEYDFDIIVYQNPAEVLAI